MSLYGAATQTHSFHVCVFFSMFGTQNVCRLRASELVEATRQNTTPTLTPSRHHPCTYQPSPYPLPHTQPHLQCSCVFFSMFGTQNVCRLRASELVEATRQNTTPTLTPSRHHPCTYQPSSYPLPHTQPHLQCSDAILARASPQARTAASNIRPTLRSACPAQAP